MAPKYPYKPVANLELLARMLGITQQELLELYSNSDSFFFLHNKERKKDGSYRYTYDVKTKLKSIHEKICTKFLRAVIYPNYLQGSLKGKDFLSNAKIHSGKKVIITEDITNFFPSISKKTVFEVWVSFFKFSKEVSEYLAEIITLDGYLVQGAKPSSYICNLVLWSREKELVDYFKDKGLTYTRYVDDITVSATRILSLEEKEDIIRRVYNLLHSIGAKPNRKKHHIMPRSSKQLVHNVNVNRNSPSMQKQRRSQIRAAVHQCENEFIQCSESKNYLDLYNRTMGRVNLLKRLHLKEGELLRQRLLKVPPKI